MSDFTLETPLRELIAIPERIEAADYVIKLDEGVSRHEQTIRDYVVTDAIAGAITEGLDLVADSLTQQSSRGAFLDGSFGSGKSHYLAILHLLLSDNLVARQIPGLEDVVAKRLDVLGKNLLVVDYNLLGARSFEDAIFSGYLETVRARHPKAAPPVLHMSDELLANAVQMRETLGDEKFFDGLGGGDAAWGEMGAAWTATTFDAAIAATPGDNDRDRLVTDLITAYFSGYTRAGEWLPIKDGLRALTAHAKSLGYQGIVLLIDEIVLWLGQHLTNEDWVQTEIEKVVQLVENAAVNLPIPITSFLARQRDLRDFLGDRGPGAERVARGQIFQYWEDRFTKIRLHAADLPRIVKQRLLRPVSTAAAATLESALAVVKRDHAAWGYLLADESHSDEKDFGDVYPFSPALVDTMVALSSLMQRERTALKLMAELLSQGRMILTASDVIPVGDLYEPVVLGGSQPLTDEMRQHFAISATFYRTKVQPYLLRKHGVSESELDTLPRTHPFVTEDRLVKTVLIAALAPEARSLTNLTAAKLAALNWGTIDAFIPGTEAQQALTIVREWASEFGEITVGDGEDPIITASLSGVDYDTILDLVRTEDNQTSRRELIRKLIAEELRLPPDNLVGRQIDHVWRGHRRSVTVKFGNIRDEADVLESDLIHSDDEWRTVIDFPYDVGTHGPADDVARLRKLRDAELSANTIGWIPNFLTDSRQSDLGKLVLLEYLLTGNRFEQNSSHLNPTDRPPARQTLESQRRTLRDLLVAVLRQAYGVNAAEEIHVGSDLSGNQIFSTLVPGLTIAPPPTGTLLTGLHYALETAWTHEFPEHPDLGAEEVTARRLNDALELVIATVEGGGRRQGLTAAEQRVARELTVPLGLAALNENVIVVDTANFRWWQQFARWEGELGDELTVGALRQKLAPWGMTRVMEDAVLLTWSWVGNFEFSEMGGSQPKAGDLPDQARPRRASLPDEEEWAIAKTRAGGVFGVAPEANLTPRAVTRFVGAVKHQAEECAAQSLVEQLKDHGEELGIDTSQLSGRLATAQRVASLADMISATSTDKEVIEILVTFDLPEVLAPYGNAHASATRLARELQGVDWQIIRAAEAMGDAGFDATLTALREAAALDESVAPLAPHLTEASAKARALVIKTPQPGPTPPPPAPSRSKKTSLAELDTTLGDIRTEIEAEAGAEDTVTITWQVD